MSTYSTITAAMLQAANARETALPLRNAACQSRFFLQPNPSSKVCLFFHGFTAAPFQFVPMAETFFRAGYNVLIPLLPGHGLAGNWNENCPPPLPSDRTIYQQFALDWLQQAKSLGDQVIVGGLSGGGTVAAWLALERCQEINRTLLFAPYLSSSNKVIDLFVRHLHSYFEWTLKPGEQPLGYTGFPIPALKAILDMGQEILNRAKNSPAPPMFIISSASDRSVSNSDHRVLFEEVLKLQPMTWYHSFDRVLDIPHTMMIKEQGNNYQDLLITMAKAFVESQLTWEEVEEIGYRMTQGKTFNQVVDELNLREKVSLDMPAMMTMVDKRAIVEERNPNARHS